MLSFSFGVYFGSDLLFQLCKYHLNFPIHPWSVSVNGGDDNEDDDNNEDDDGGEDDEDDDDL